MSLIKCPECGKEISSWAEVCIHCGYPLKKSIVGDTDDNIYNRNDNICYIEGKPYDLSDALGNIKRHETVNAIKAIRDMTGFGLMECKRLCDEIESTNRIPERFIF